MISHDGTAFFSPRISGMVLFFFFGQGSRRQYLPVWPPMLTKQDTFTFYVLLCNLHSRAPVLFAETFLRGFMKLTIVGNVSRNQSVKQKNFFTDFLAGIHFDIHINFVFQFIIKKKSLSDGSCWEIIMAKTICCW